MRAGKGCFSPASSVLVFKGMGEMDEVRRNYLLRYWLPPLVWMGLIFYFSTDRFSGENTASYLELVIRFFHPAAGAGLILGVNLAMRKAAHFTEYAILGALYYRAFRGAASKIWDPYWALCSLIAVAVYALLDEFHQTFTRSRTGSIRDSLIDFSGALAAMIAIRLAAERRSGPAR